MTIDLPWLEDDDEHHDSVRLLRAYFADSDGVPSYSGSRFEVFGENPTNRIVVDDLVAVSMLSVAVPAHAVLRILERDAGPITSLLMRIPAECDLHDADARLIDRESHAEQLWKVLRDGIGHPQRVGMGPVRLSKLIARKRPRLVPVYDRYVKDALGLPNSDDHWLELHRFLREEPHRVATLTALGAEAGVPPAVPLLRILDVLLWMRGRTDDDARSQKGSDEPE